MRTLVRSAFTLAAFAAVIPAPARAQGRFPPDSLTNVKVFPRGTEVRTVINAMRGFTGALGVRCQYCHVGREGMPLDSFNFPSDSLRTKRTARVMMRMVQAINDTTLTQIPERPTPAVQVTCATCHHGQARPRTIEDMLAEGLQRGGLDSAVARYRDLRQRYYGSWTYDFSEQNLGNFALGVAQRGQADNAIGLLNLNIEFNPNSGFAYAVLGEAYRMRGDTATAVTNFRTALQKDPTNQIATRRLREMHRN
jgi:hypothetical protein